MQGCGRLRYALKRSELHLGEYCYSQVEPLTKRLLMSFTSSRTLTGYAQNLHKVYTPVFDT